MINRLLAVTVLGAVALSTPANARDIRGRASVVDGDTLYVGQVKIRLNRIDAPERGAPYSRAATDTLKRLVANQTVLCRLNGDKSYDRFVAVCYVGEPDLAAAVIASGFVLDFPWYYGGRYRQFETDDARRRLRQANYC